MITKWQTLFLLIMTLPIMGHVVILPLMFDVAGRDTFISIFISIPFALLFAYAIRRVRLYYPVHSAKDALYFLLGKWGSRISRFIFISYFLFLTIVSLATLVDFVYIGFFPDTPVPVLIIWFMIFFLYAATKGIKQIALTAGLVGLIAIVTGHTITLMDSKMKDWGELLPLLEFGWSPPLWGALILISIWVEILFLFFLPVKDVREKFFFFFWVIGIFVISLTMFSTSSGSITIFGLGQSDNFTYPAQEIVRLINLGFIDRFDIYGMILMTFGCYIRCSLFFRLAYDLSLPKAPSKSLKVVMFILFILITFFVANFVAKKHFRVNEMIDIYTYMVILYPIPFIMLFISYIKNKRKRMNA